MLFPDYKNTTSVTLTTNTNPSYTVTQPCMVLINGVGQYDSNNMYCTIDGVDVRNLLSTVGKDSTTLGDRVTLFLNTGSTISVIHVGGLNRNATIRIIPLVNMGGV